MDDFDRHNVDEIVLALMQLTLHDYYRAWKGFDWDTLDRLYEKDSLCQAFLGPMWSKRKNEAGEVEKCLQLGMSQCTTPLTAVKPLRFP